MEAAVDAQFVEQARPVFRRGSRKWRGVQRWGWYVNLFFAVSVGEQASLAISPLEYLRCWDREPRLMSILEVVQSRVRWNIAEKMRKSKRGRTGHLPTRTPTQG